MAASLIISLFSYRGLGISIAVIVILTLLNLVVLPDIDRIEARSKLSPTDFRQLMLDRRYMLLVVILTLMYSMVIANNCTVIE